MYTNNVWLLAVCDQRMHPSAEIDIARADTRQQVLKVFGLHSKKRQYLGKSEEPQSKHKLFGMLVFILPDEVIRWILVR